MNHLEKAETAHFLLPLSRFR